MKKKIIIIIYLAFLALVAEAQYTVPNGILYSFHEGIEDDRVQVFSLDGRLIEEGQVSGNYANGIYLVKRYGVSSLLMIAE